MPIGANSGNDIDSATLNEQDYKISLISLHREIQSFHSDHGVKEYTTLLDNLIIKTLELIKRSELYPQPQPLPPPPRPNKAMEVEENYDLSGSVSIEIEPNDPNYEEEPNP